MVVFFAFFIIFSKYPLFGRYKFYSVISGSMEPTLKIGSLVIVQKKDEYFINDIITFFLDNNKNTVTHRIQKVINENKNILFQVKGDANNAPDTSLVLKENVVGKVVYSIPLIGFPISFAKTQTGFIILVIIPATLLIYSEILTIKKETIKLIQARKTRKLTAMEKVEEKIGEEIIEVEEDVKKVFKPKNKKKK